MAISMKLKARIKEALSQAHDECGKLDETTASLRLTSALSETDPRLRREKLEALHEEYVE